MEGEAETVSSSPVSLLNSLVNSALNYSSKQHYHFPGALGPSGQGTLDSITAGLYAFRIICLNSSSLLQKILCMCVCEILKIVVKFFSLALCNILVTFVFIL